MSCNVPPRILLIDDDDKLINELCDELSSALEDEPVEIVTWVPKENDEDPDELLNRHAPKGTVMVVTDYDLTRKGMRGFQGSAVQSWCQRNLIPVGDFSRGQRVRLPEEPNLFGMNIPVETPSATVAYVAAAYHGFAGIRASVSTPNHKGRSISAITADILGRSSYEPLLSLYFSRLASSNTAIRDHLQQRVSKPGDHDREDKLDVLAYVISHVLLNLILAFPGPILSRKVLAAYLAVSEEEAKEVVEIAKISAYDGPFAKIQPFVWREDVDKALADTVSASDDEPPNDTERYNRFASELVLHRTPSKHNCQRDECHGERGGYWCPFTKRPVCCRDDCSEASTAWIPEGADLCRVEAEFFEEFVPLLGL